MRKRELDEQGAGGKSVPGTAAAAADDQLAMPVMELWNLHCAKRDVCNLMANTEEMQVSAWLWIMQEVWALAQHWGCGRRIIPHFYLSQLVSTAETPGEPGPRVLILVLGQRGWQGKLFVRLGWQWKWGNWVSCGVCINDII